MTQRGRRWAPWQHGARHGVRSEERPRRAATVTRALPPRSMQLQMQSPRHRRLEAAIGTRARGRSTRWNRRTWALRIARRGEARATHGLSSPRPFLKLHGRPPCTVWLLSPISVSASRWPLCQKPAVQPSGSFLPRRQVPVHVGLFFPSKTQVAVPRSRADCALVAALPRTRGRGAIPYPPCTPHGPRSSPPTPTHPGPSPRSRRRPAGPCSRWALPGGSGSC